MSRKLAPWIITLAAATITAVTTAPASAAIIDPAPIGPNQYFSGLVNGQLGHAAIRMACFGPIRPGQTGHPFAGQTVEVLPDPVSTTSDIGFTGSTAHAINVHFPTPTVANAPVVLLDYAVTAAIPVSLTLPCFGSGPVAFLPQPTKSTPPSLRMQTGHASGCLGVSPRAHRGCSPVDGGANGAGMLSRLGSDPEPKDSRTVVWL